MGTHLNESVRAVMADLSELSEGARGTRRAETETNPNPITLLTLTLTLTPTPTPYPSPGSLVNFEQMLQHIFAPLFEVSADPASHPKLHLMLQQVRPGYPYT